MGKKILLISEFFSAPFDEGLKNVAFSLHNHLEKKMAVLTVTGLGNDTSDLNITKIRLNRLFLNITLSGLIKNYLPDIILYLPEASITFSSFIRIKVLKFMSRLSKVVMLGVQHREYSSIQNIIISNLLRPDLLLLLGRTNEVFFLQKGIKVKVLPPAVDSSRFNPAASGEKKKIRFEYNIPDDVTVVLHVGHIRKTRNVECLLEVQKSEDIQVVIVDSTSTKTERSLKDKLVKAGVRVIDGFVQDISKIYKMSDIYVFPVLKNYAAIDMPLSVLEAMACNLSVITTRFGGLVDYFKEDSWFRYFDTTEELIEIIRGMDKGKAGNYKKVEHFTWDGFTNEIIAACEGLV